MLNGMSELVRDYFLDVPERCLDCPALEAAAQNLAFFFAVATASATQEENPTNPLVSGEYYLASLHTNEETRHADAARFVTDMTVEESEKVHAIAEDLYSKCGGALNDEKEREEKVGRIKSLKIVALTRQCRSTTEIARFFPTIYTEHTLK